MRFSVAKPLPDALRAPGFRIQKLRRGLSFVEIDSRVDLVRRGLPKFFDLEAAPLEASEVGRKSRWRSTGWLRRSCDLWTWTTLTLPKSRPQGHKNTLSSRFHGEVVAGGGQLVLPASEHRATAPSTFSTTRANQDVYQ